MGKDSRHTVRTFMCLALQQVIVFPLAEDSIDVQLPATFEACQHHLPSAHPRRISAFAGLNTASGACAVAVSALTDSVAMGPGHKPKPTSYSYSYAQETFLFGLVGCNTRISLLI